VFLPTDFIDTDEEFWTDRLGRVIAALEARGKDFAADDPAEPMIGKIAALPGPPMDRFEAAIGMLKPLPAGRIRDINDNFFTRLEIPRNGSERSFLSWEEVRAMRESGVVRFGSHTRSHVILTTVDEKLIFEELSRSKERLLGEKAVSESFIPFSYPNGDHTDRIVEMVRRAGYSMALTTRRGDNRYMNGPVDVFRLKRIGIHQDMSSTNSLLSCRIGGIF
jgi:hypothetical protein